jgi:hypothetical protein
MPVTSSATCLSFWHSLQAGRSIRKKEKEDKGSLNTLPNSDRGSSPRGIDIITETLYP